MRRLRRLLRLTFGRTMRENVAEFAGFGLLVFAAWTVHEVAGLVVGGIVLLNYAYSGVWRNR